MMKRNTTRNYAALLLALPGAVLVLCMVALAMKALEPVGAILKAVAP